MTPQAPAVSAGLHRQFGDIDIYLFDQLLRGRFDHRQRIFDAGCGGGRNLPFFFAHRFEIWAADVDPHAIAGVRRLAASMGVDLPSERLHAGPLDALPWADEAFDAVVCSAVLHFAHDADAFGRTLQELWRVLARGGLFFARLATSIGLESRLAAPVGRVRLPDGSERFVVDEETLLAWTTRLGGRLADPIKTTNVQNSRCMTTWVMEK